MAPLPVISQEPRGTSNREVSKGTSSAAEHKNAPAAVRQRTQKKRLAPLQFAIAAGKGGVGKSMLCAHLAGALAQKGLRVGLLDADLYGPSQPTMLQVDRPAKATVQEGQERITPAKSGGIHVISLGLFRKEGEAIAARAPIANSLITRFLNQVDWGALDLLLIDLPPGTGDIHLSLSQQLCIDAACLISTPQKVCLEDVRRARDLLHLLCIPVIGFVLNMTHLIPSYPLIHPFGSPDVELWEGLLGAPCLGQIPLDPALSQCGDEGRMLFAAPPKGSEVSAALLQDLAQTILSRGKELLEEGRGQFFLRLDEVGKPSLFEGKHFPLARIELLPGEKCHIVWKSGSAQTFSLPQLLRRCPCASCSARRAQQRKEGLLEKEGEPMGITAIENVGNYGLRILSKKGCRHGFFLYSDLEKVTAAKA